MAVRSELWKVVHWAGEKAARSVFRSAAGWATPLAAPTAVLRAARRVSGWAYWTAGHLASPMVDSKAAHLAGQSVVSKVAKSDALMDILLAHSRAG
jgi:hypothetical protein